MTSSEYFLQDLFVSRCIHDAAPVRHVDIGSLIDGFAAHVVRFREIEVFDIRPLTAQIPGIVFRQADLMLPADYCDSMSCLHALEHFGLGRQDDPLGSEGHVRGLANMTGLPKSGFAPGPGVFRFWYPLRVQLRARLPWLNRRATDRVGENVARINVQCAA